MKKNAIILTQGYLDSDKTKTAHGLIRGTDRFTIVGVIDHACAGRDAGDVLDGKKRNIPVFSSIKDFVATGIQAAYCIVGFTTKGGTMPETLHAGLREALESGYGLINGLHATVSSIPDLSELARHKGLEIIDIRKPKAFKDLHFWSGKIQRVRCPKVAVLGTDCALGKRTTARMLVHTMRKEGYQAEMIYTGQTGWMQGAQYGFIFDSTLNDFISGEMEHAVVTCWEEKKPDIIFIEGQSSLRNPSGPAGAEWMVSAHAVSVVLQHDPTRTHYKDLEDYPALIPSIDDEIALIKMYGADTLAVTINTACLEEREARDYVARYEQQLNVPVVLPLEEGLERTVPVFENLIAKYRAELK